MPLFASAIDNVVYTVAAVLAVAVVRGVAVYHRQHGTHRPPNSMACCGGSPMRLCGWKCSERSMGVGGVGLPRTLSSGAGAGVHGPALLATGVLLVRRRVPLP